MGRSPLWARRNSRSISALALTAITLASVPAASGKKPDASNGAGAPATAASPGQGVKNTGGGKGHGNGKGGKKAPSPTTLAAPVATRTATTTTATKTHSGPKSRGKKAATDQAAAPAQAAPATVAAAAVAAPTPSAPPAATAPPAVERAAKQRASARRAARRHAQLSASHRRAALRASATGTTAQHLPGAVAAARAGANGATAKKPARARPRIFPTAPIVRTLERVVQVIPFAVKAIIGALGVLLLIASAAWFLRARAARRLAAQREMLLEEVGVLQGALLPTVPAELSRLQASVAYTPAEGLAAGGDFYDAFALDDGRVGIVVGDVAGHGRDALMHTALLRYTLRAYLEADLEPRVALQVAGRSLDRGFDTLATVVLAVYDPNARVLTYACGGHPPPVFLGEADHVPVTVASSPPIGSGLPTGLRQTTVCLPAGSAVCFFTDGLIEARRDEQLIGRLGLIEIIRRLGPHATATQVLERVAEVADRVDDDMAACMFRVLDGPAEAPSPRVEELEVRRGEPLEITLGRFLESCGVDAETHAHTIIRAGRTMRSFRGAVVRVSLPAEGPRVQVSPANVESFASAEARRDATVLAAGRG